MSAHDLAPALVPTMYFVGVTTAQSAIVPIYPRWAEVLGISPALRGLDFPLGAPPEAYRAAVAHIKHDPLSLGGLVTSHKLNLLQASLDLFDQLGESARLLHEVSSVSKRGATFWGRALDDVTSGLALRSLLPSDHWKASRGELLLLGGGGASIATTLCLHRAEQTGADTPSHIHVCDVDARRLVDMRTLHADIGFSIPITYRLAGAPSDNDAVMAALPDGSMVINATGMGKDRPGSPLTDAARFPNAGVVWELNYRGELAFLAQARQQERSRSLAVHDGWDYFIYSWTQVIADVHDIEIPTSGPLFELLSAIARDASRKA